jgi:hypothetical protein
MDPITIIVTAIVAGAAVASQEMAAQAVKDGYAGLKSQIIQKFGQKSDLEDAIKGIEKKPKSESRQGVLKEELEDANADQVEDIVQQAQVLLKLLEEQGEDVKGTYRAVLHGSGAIAQGSGTKAVGERGVMIGGDAKVSTIITGDENEVESKK